MNPSSISSSSGLLLSLKEWIVAALCVVAVCAAVQSGWYRCETFEPGPDYRLPCWAEKMSDYWSFRRWCRYANPRFQAFILGDSIIWGQEVRNDQTISHYLNEKYGDEVFANMGLDGLHPAAIYGLVKYHGTYLEGKRVLLQFNPFWMCNENYDLQG